MFFRQFYHQPLAQASYLIGCQMTGDAVVIDANRDVAQYLEVAAEEGLRVTHVTETHIHADFVSGSRELAAVSGAQLYLSAEGGEAWQYRFAQAANARLVRDGDVIRVGNVTLIVIHTPGHTPEHLSFIVEDTPRSAGPMGIVTGDFVFVGDVGRPDLLERAAGVANTMDDAAHQLFQSLKRFHALPDHLQLWPGHGAGSACGKALGAVPSSTVGYEKLSNWGVSEDNEALFVAAVLDGQPEPPRYFADMKRINRDGPVALGHMPMPKQLRAGATIDVAPDVWLIDVRRANAFAAAHIPSSLSLPFGKSFTTWAGSIVPITSHVVLLAVTAADATAAAHELAMIGLDQVDGWLQVDEAIAAWRASGRTTASVAQADASTVAALPSTARTIVDVRGESEWSAGHIDGALHVPLGALASRLNDLPTGPLVLQCQGGTRSAVASSLLKRLGRHDVTNLSGGYDSWIGAAARASSSLRTLDSSVLSVNGFSSS